MIRVLLVDDQQVVRRGLGLRLHLEPDMHVVGEARSGKEALTLAQALAPDVVLMDVEMPEMDGIFGSSSSLNSLFGGYSAFATSIGTGFLGWAALRAHALSRPLAWTLIIIGLVTIPILFATPLPIGPDWATDFLAFLLSGIGYTLVGLRMLSARQQASAATTSVAPQVVAQAK